MSNLLLKILPMSLWGSIIILLILILRKIFYHAPARILLLLWVAAGIRLVCPFTIFQKVWKPAVNVVFETREELTEDLTQSEILDILKEEGYMSPDEESSLVRVKIRGSLFDRLNTVWIIGFTGMITAMILMKMIMRQKEKQAVPFHLETIESEPGLTSALRFFYSAQPFVSYVSGITHPKIFLPYTASDQELQLIKEHETMHVKQRDPLWKTLGIVTLAIHWFNPLVWIGFFCFSGDIECACDEAVTRYYDAEKKAAYAKTLLDFSINKPIIFPEILCFFGADVKTRILKLLDIKKTKGKKAMAALGLLLLFSFSTVTAYGENLLDFHQVSLIPRIDADLYEQIKNEVYNNAHLSGTPKLRLVSDAHISRLKKLQQNQTNGCLSNDYIFCSLECAKGTLSGNISILSSLNYSEMEKDNWAYVNADIYGYYLKDEQVYVRNEEMKFRDKLSSKDHDFSISLNEGVFIGAYVSINYSIYEDPINKKDMSEFIIGQNNISIGYVSE